MVRFLLIFVALVLLAPMIARSWSLYPNHVIIIRKCQDHGNQHIRYVSNFSDVLLISCRLVFHKDFQSIHWYYMESLWDNCIHFFSVYTEKSLYALKDPICKMFCY